MKIHQAPEQINGRMCACAHKKCVDGPSGLIVRNSGVCTSSQMFHLMSGIHAL